MAPHSSTFAWKIPWMEEPGRLQSMRSLRVRHNWATSLSLSTFMHWRRKWQPTPVFLPGESHGQRSLVGYSPWDHKELDTTEQLTFHFHFILVLIVESLSHIQLSGTPLDCSPPGSSVHGILQARILEWVAMPFSRASSRSRDWTVSCL